MPRLILPLLMLTCAWTAHGAADHTGVNSMAKTTDSAATPTLVGKTAPAFSLKDQAGATHKLTDYKGKYVVIYFYPKDDTPGCTRQACGFRDELAAFRERDVVVLGISILDEASKQKFATKHKLNFPLLADADNKVAAAYGVWKEKSMYGKTYWGVSRETFIISPAGKIVQHWDKAKGSEEHAAEVLAWLKENS